MGIGAGIFLIAIGAILKFAVHVHDNSSGVDLATIGVILMVVGVAGIALSMVFWNTMAGFGGRRRTEITETRSPEYAPGGRRVVREEYDA